MDKVGQAILYYLYMQADYEISEHEKTIYNAICQELELTKDDIIKVADKLKDCENKKLDCLGYVKRQCEFSELGVGAIKLFSEENGIEGFNYRIEKNVKKEVKASVLWNLINLGYADKTYSREEKDVVEFLKKYWEIPDVVYQEMVDVAETCLALSEYEGWVKTLENSEYKVKKLEQVGNDLKTIEESIKRTIAEYAL